MTDKSLTENHQVRGGFRELLEIALPMIVSTACDGIMTFTDRLFLSRLGSEQMNAAMSGGVSLQVLTFFFIGLIGYSTALVAQYLGSGQKHLSSVSATQAGIVAIIASPFIYLCAPLSVLFAQVMKVPQGQLGYQIAYFNILIYGVPFSLLRAGLSCYFSGIGKTKIVMYANLFAVVANVFLDYVLIFGKFGFPQMGVEGAAIATITGSVMGMLIMALGYFGKENRKEFSIMKSFRFDWKIMKKLLYFGYPAGLEFFLNFLAFSIIIFVFHSRGNEVATASTIMFNWDLISFIPLLGIEIAVTSLSGRYMGAGEPDVVHTVVKSGIKTGIFYSFAVLLAFVFMTDFLVEVFRPDIQSAIFEQARPMAVSMIKLATLYVLAEAIMVALVGALRGAGDTHFTMLASVTFHWLLAPFLFIMMEMLNFSPVSGWLLLIILYLLFCVALYLRYRGGYWKKIKVIENAA
jgi:MATE family multidrug resistance protein